MATFTVHQWADLQAGLHELLRVTRGRIVIMTSDPAELDRFWLNYYAPEVIAIEAKRYAPLSSITSILGEDCEIVPVPIPLHCSDGFNEACSSWSFIDRFVVERFERDLSRDLADGTWDTTYGHLRRQPEFLGSLKLIISTTGI